MIGDTLTAIPERDYSITIAELSISRYRLGSQATVEAMLHGDGNADRNHRLAGE